LQLLEHDDDVDFIIRGVRTLNDVRYFARMINDEAKQRSLYIDKATPTECIRIYNECKNAFLVSNKTKKGRDRNTVGLKWLVVNDKAASRGSKA
jgi:hypothetical protein